MLETADNGYAYKRLLYPNSLSLDAMHFLPYVDSASWLYLDPNPVLPVRLPSLECDALLTTEQRHHRHHHHCQRHHHHHHHHRHRDKRHRRVLSDPGGWNADMRTDTTRHRRVLSGNADLMRASIDEANEDNLSPEEDTRASTFRKVPWHPNLHMLRRT